MNKTCKIILGVIFCFLILLLITGCSNNKKIRIEEIKGLLEEKISANYLEVVEAKENAEETMKNIDTLKGTTLYESTMKLNKDLIEQLPEYSAAMVCDAVEKVMTNEEEKLKGFSLYYVGDEKVDGFSVGSDDNNTVYNIYLKSEKYNDVWAYATVNLNTRRNYLAK